MKQLKGVLELPRQQILPMAGRTFSGLQSLLLLVLLLLTFGSVTRASIYITLRNSSDTSMTYRTYSYVVFYDTKFSNIDSKGMLGYLHQPEPKSGCSTIDSGPNSSNATGSWFAVIDYYPTACSISTVLSNVQNAGYDLVVVADTSTSRSQTNDVKLTADDRKIHFPIVIISKNYTDYLIDRALSNFSDPEVKATVKADSDLFIVILIMASMFVALPACMICCALCCYYRALRLRQYREIAGIQHRRGRNFERLTEHDRIARRELIDSILRQLQQLQLEGEIQRPLGAEQTRKLPTRKYECTSTPESCAICVDDFKDKDTVRVLPCKHYFHINCIDEWLTNHSDVCPLCKSQVPKENPEDQQGTGRRGAAMAAFDEDEETDSDYPLVSNERNSRSGQLYGSLS